MTQKKFEVDNYYQDLPELGNRALNLLDMFMKHIGAESMKDYAWLQSWIHDMSKQHLCLSYKQHTLSILVGLYYVEGGQAYLKAMGPEFMQLHLDFCEENHLTPCYFPINAETGLPVYSDGCPLMDAHTYQQLDLNGLGDDNGGMMSEWEVHNCGVLAMMQHLHDQGLNVVSYCDMLDASPQIFFEEKDGTHCGLFVRSVAVGNSENKYHLPMKTVNEYPEMHWYFADVHWGSFWSNLDFKDKELIRRSPLCHNDFKIIPLGEAIKTMPFIEPDESC